jgi:hypothetical protein
MYEVPKSKKSLKQNQFEFKLNGKVHRVPLLQYMRPAVAREFKDGMNELQAAELLFKATGQPDLMDEFDDFQQVADFVAAWQEASTVTAGESSASSAS